MTEKTDKNNKNNTNNPIYEIYSIDHYATGNNDFIENNKQFFTNKKN